MIILTYLNVQEFCKICNSSLATGPALQIKANSFCHIFFFFLQFFQTMITTYLIPVSNTLFFYLLFANGPIVKVDVTNNI